MPDHAHEVSPLLVGNMSIVDHLLFMHEHTEWRHHLPEYEVAREVLRGRDELGAVEHMTKAEACAIVAHIRVHELDEEHPRATASQTHVLVRLPGQEDAVPITPTQAATFIAEMAAALRRIL